MMNSTRVRRRGQAHLLTAATTVSLAWLSACASRGTSGRYYCPESAIGGESIWYLAGTIYEKTGNEIRMSDYSVWRVDRMPYGVTAFSEAGIVASDTAGPGLAYFSGGNTADVVPVRGSPIWRRGHLVRVSSVDTDAFFLRTSDGRSWEVNEFDRFTAQMWFGPFPAAVHESNLLLTNLDRIEEVGVAPLCPGVSEGRIRALTDDYP